MFSRFQILTAGLNVLKKGYSTSDHVKKIIRSFPKKWRPMVTTLKLAKDLNTISLEKLISSLKSHDIELEKDEPQKKGKSLALKDRINTKPPIFDGENFEYWKDSIESTFLGYDADLWDMVLDGYTHPIDDAGQN